MTCHVLTTISSLNHCETTTPIRTVEFLSTSDTAQDHQQTQIGIIPAMVPYARDNREFIDNFKYSTSDKNTNNNSQTNINK